ncbi:CBS domain-containing protein CBSCBSPB3 [Ananas comosus]|uniref:CBS domain-containing protein CBSCBSPB3 n=1 Tax=Ananas comosus TaxID=4615 RepID=A0A199UJ01_ANACO|nr:CBS domain-containing protein CBSCBSPB3 [Ananas comosus]
MSSHAVPHQRRISHSARRAPAPAAAARKLEAGADGGGAGGGGVANGKSSKPTSPSNQPSGERTVKKLRLSKALTIPEGTTVSDACRRMAARRVDSVLLTDANGLLSGIVTDKDISTRVIAEGLRPEQTIVSKIMTRNPVFVMSDALAMEALQKMLQGKFRHLPVVENGEVVAMLDITKCLYDAISRMEKAAEQGSALAAAVEEVERQYGSNFSAPYAFIETLRERMFKPSLSTVITENSKVAIVFPSDPVYVATKKMRDNRINSVIVMTGSAVQGILTSKDVLMRVVAQHLSPELTLVEKVMTPNPECATLDTTILEALHIMHDGKFLHIPVLDRDGNITACLDVLQITHAALSMPPDDELDSRSDVSMLMASECAEGKYTNPPSVGHSFAFKLEDRKGRVHRFNSGTENLTELVTAVKQRIGINDEEKIQLLYEDEEGDKVLLTTDGDLTAAVYVARSAGWKVLRLHVDDVNAEKETAKPSSKLATAQKSRWTPIQVGFVTGAVALTTIGVVAYLKRSNV